MLNLIASARGFWALGPRPIPERKRSNQAAAVEIAPHQEPFVNASTGVVVPFREITQRLHQACGPRQAGGSWRTVLLQTGRRRLRPVLLATVTIVAGMFALLLENACQAQVVIPMATSLCLGLIFSTLLFPLLVSYLYVLAERTNGKGRWDGDELTSASGQLASTVVAKLRVTGS